MAAKKKAAAKKAPARKVAAKKGAAKRAPARKAAAAKKTATKRSSAKKAPARKAAAKKTAARKAPASRRGTAAKKAARKGPQRKPLTPKPQRMQQAMAAVQGVLDAVSNAPAGRTAKSMLDAVTNAPATRTAKNMLDAVASAPGRLAEQVGRMTHSTKPLAQRLRVGEGMIATVLGAPEEPSALLGPLPQGARIATELAEGIAPFVLVFVRNQAEVAQRIAQLAQRVTAKSLVWFAYPKQSSKVETDLTRDRGWEAATQAGFEAVAQVAVDAVWAATRFIKRT